VIFACLFGTLFSVVIKLKTVKFAPENHKTMKNISMKSKALPNSLIMFDGSMGRIYTDVRFDGLFKTLFSLYVK